MSRRLSSLLLAAAFWTGSTSSLFAAPFNVTGNDTAAKTLAPASGGSETGTVTSAGDLNLSTNAVAVTITGGSGTRTAIISNNGKIRQTATGATAARAIRNSSGVATITVTNGAGALIQAADADAMQVSVAGSNVSVDNSGSIIVSPNLSAGGNQAIDWNGITTGSNSLVNQLTGLISATAADGVRPGVNGIINNAGTIQAIPVPDSSTPGVTQASSSDGIDAQTNSGVTITNSGTISGRHGITGGATAAADFTISVTNQSGGVLSGVNGSGINIDSNGARLGNATVINSGTITGNFDVAHYNTGDGDGVDVDGLCTLTNNGIIRGLGASGNGSDGGGNNPEGVSIGGGTVINNAGAEITGQDTSGSGRKGHGLLVDDSSGGNAPGATNLTNAGLIRGFDSYGVRIVSTLANTLLNDTTGTIRGGGNAVEGAAIQTTAGIDTLTNRGAIVGDNGLAVDLGDGDDVMHVLGDSASITGDVSGGAGNNTLDFDPASGAASSSSQTFSYSGALSNFASVSILSGTVSLSGASTYTGDTTVSGANLVVSNTSGSATGTGRVIVNSNASLSGAGTVASVASEGTIAPRGGTLNITGDLRLTTNFARLSFEVGSQSSVQLNVGGNLDFFVVFNPIEVMVYDTGIVPGRDYTLARFASLSDGPLPSFFTLGPGAPPGTTLELTSNTLVLHTPALSLSPTSLGFGAQVTNTVSSEQTVTVTNSGTAPLVIGTPAIAGSNGRVFQVSSNGCTGAIAPNGSCTIGVRFAPTTTGNNQTASLSIPSNAASSPDSVSLSGNAVEALYQLTASPASVDFGNQPVGTTSQPNFVQLRNTGNSAIRVFNFNVSGAQATDFSDVGGSCNDQPLAPGDSCSVAFTFTPGASGTRNAVEQVVTFPVETSTPTNIAVRGIGTQAGASLTPASLAFGNQLLNTSSQPQPVNLVNSGNTSLTITGLSVSGDFTVDSSCPTVLAAGASCHILVTFAPQHAGSLSGQLTVNSNAPDSPAQAALSGTGITPPAGTLGLVFSSVTVEEGPGQTLTFMVSRTSGSYGAVTVQFATSDGGAKAGRDYAATSGTLSWADGDTSPKPINVPVIDNHRGDGSRSFTLSLSSPTGNSSLGTATGTGTITDDDRSGLLSFDARTTTVSDQAGSITLVVHRERGAGHAATVQYDTRNGTAIAGTHYTARSGNLSWAAGDWSDRTITVPVTVGALSRGQRSFSVDLSAPTGGVRLGIPATETVTIQYGR